MTKILTPFIAVLFCLSFMNKIGEQQFKTAVSEPKKVAILPARVVLNLRRGEMQRTTQQQVLDAERDMGFMIQTDMYRWFAENSSKYHYTVDIQSPEDSNDSLFSKGLSYENYKLLGPDSIARILGVDAVVLCNTEISKTMSDAADAAVSLGVFLLPGNLWMPGNTHLNVEIGIAESTTGKITWRSSYKSFSGDSIDKILNRILKNAAKIFPYRSK